MAIVLSTVFQNTRISSIIHTTASRPLRIQFILRWNIFRALAIPNGNLLKAYRSNRVINVVNSLDLSDKEICQKPLFASSLENTAAPDN